MTDTASEKKLLYRLQVKLDPDAYAALYDLYVKQIYRFVYFKVSAHEEAEDITSEVFLKAWHYIQEHREVKSFRGLLYRIARNCIIDLYRVRQSKAEVALDEEVDVGDGGKWYADVSVKLETQKIIQALKKLKQEYQEVVTLRYIDELSIEEIAEVVEKGTIAVRVTLHRAVKKLQLLLNKESST